MLQREKSLHVIINFSIRAKDEIEGWRLFGDSCSSLIHACVMLFMVGIFIIRFMPRGGCSFSNSLFNHDVLFEWPSMIWFLLYCPPTS